MIIGVLKEIKPNEYRVAAIPATVQELTSRGHEVLVEHNAGKGSGYSDEEYIAAGATVLQTAEEVYTKAELFYKVKEMFPEEYKYMNKDKIVYTYIHSNAHPEETDAILESKVTAIAYEDITDKDGNFPLLKPMSILAGKGGFLAALHHRITDEMINTLAIAMDIVIEEGDIQERYRQLKNCLDTIDRYEIERK